MLQPKCRNVREDLHLLQTRLTSKLKLLSEDNSFSSVISFKHFVCPFSVNSFSFVYSVCAVCYALFGYG